ncbi:MAG: repressor LexA [Chloroflexi bacterium]|nr:repressor LexA [Chloroflexota bacterium]
MKGLSDKQQAILDFLRQFIRNKDYPPSIRDIQLGCKISSTSVVDYNLKALERLGYIRRDREVSRAIEMLDGTGRRPHTVPVPIVGTIAAGSPIPVFEPGTSYEEVVNATEEMTRGKENVYALRVKGTSMIDALVNDGDIVIMEKTNSAEDGEMIAAWLKDEEETTLKRLYTEGDRIRLQPANETMKPIYTRPENLEIQGRVLTTISHHN